MSHPCLVDGWRCACSFNKAASSPNPSQLRFDSDRGSRPICSSCKIGCLSENEDGKWLKIAWKLSMKTFVDQTVWEIGEPGHSMSNGRAPPMAPSFSSRHPRHVWKYGVNDGASLETKALLHVRDRQLSSCRYNVPQSRPSQSNLVTRMKFQYNCGVEAWNE